MGTIERIEIANMHRQTEEREERLLAAVPDAPPARTGVVAVVRRRRQPAPVRDASAPHDVVEGGQTMNPATAELVAAIEAVRRTR